MTASEDWEVVKDTYHHKDLRNALIEEALAALAEGGFATLTLRELARRLGVTHAAPYAHFADKRALLEAVALVGCERLGDIMEDIAAGDLAPEAKVIEMSRAYVRYAQSQPNLYRLMFVAPELTENGVSDALRTGGERAFNALTRALAEFVPSDAATEAGLRDRAVAAWAMVHGIAMLVIDDRTGLKSERSPDEIAQMAAMLLTEGLRRSPV
jgi:AcrR family transcriptional regulator